LIIIHYFNKNSNNCKSNKNNIQLKNMRIIIGLGNPGKKYDNTPHNAGFEAIDQFAKENNFPEFRPSKKFNALISEKDNVLLAKPQTFMNDSGKSVSAIANFYKTKNLTVIHDDIDLPLGETKISQNRGSAGHKGVESIIRELGTKDFTRIRIGVSQEKKPDVLKKFDKENKKIIKEAIKQAIYELGNS
jgi:peptidyl-tRNA hydrolase, PTH1 family